jgi:flagellar biosynthesis/type III secretory pathway protein FliH
MGRLIKARDVAVRPDPLGRRGRGRLTALLESRARACGLDPAERRRVLELAGRAAELLVGDAVERDGTLLAGIYERALASMGPVAPLSIRVHPDDRAASGIDGLASRRGFQVIDDAAVGRGGCVAIFEGAEVDAGLPALEAALREAAEGGEA